MQTVQIVLNVIIANLSYNHQNENNDVTYQIISFFDQDYPQRLYSAIFEIPIIYYIGDISRLAHARGILISHSPSYYAQKIIKDIRLTNNVISLKSNANSITKCCNLCDIIYCNDVYELHKYQTMLAFSIGKRLSNVYQIQLISQLITTLYVVEGYPNVSSFDFIAQSIDNQVEVLAVPTNIYLSGSKLPNILLSQGIAPLLVN